MNTAEFKIKSGGGDTKIIRTKKQKERRAAIEKAFKAAMKKYTTQKFVKCKAIETFGGLYLGHPKEMHFNANPGEVLGLPEAQFEELKKIGRVERA